MPERHLASLGRITVVLAVLAGFLVAIALDAAPEFHHRLHRDADGAHHECLVTMLHIGGFESVPHVPLISRAPVEVHQLFLGAVGIAPLSFFLACSVFEHGPPVLS